MLKIKDNIDLKELEKFGFVKDTYYGGSDVESYRCIIYQDGDLSYFMIEVDIDKKITIWGTIHKEFIHIDVLFDLIKAGFVEKIEE